MPIREYVISSVGDLLEILPRVYGPHRKTVWFRGHADESWKLRPSILRPPRTIADEMFLLKRFKQQAVPFLENGGREESEWLFLMQHYGVSTRLLDFSEGPLVGLYFALQRPEAGAAETTSVLWCLFPSDLNRIANIDMAHPSDFPSFGDDKELDKYLPRIIREVPSDTGTAVAIIAPRHFKRLYAQQGVFVLFHRDDTPIEELSTRPPVVKIKIHRRNKPRLRRELEYLMVNELAMFPELEKVGKRIREIQ